VLEIPLVSYLVKLWDRKMLDGVMDAVPELKGSSERRIKVLRSIDKVDRVKVRGLQRLLAEGRADESGDFTEGAHLSVGANNFITMSSSAAFATGPIFKTYTSTTLISESQDPEIQFKIQEFENGQREPFDAKAYKSFVEDYLEGEPIPSSLEAGLHELNEISRLVEISGYGDRVKLDRSVVRGLEYYTGPVFEVELALENKDKAGRLVRFGSVAGGGRYDGLVGRFRNDQVPATGFSIGVSRLTAALTHLGKIDTNAEAGPVVITVFEKDRLADYQRMTQMLRNAGIRAELYLGSGKMGPQLKYADKRVAPCVVIQGGDEKAKGEIQIKDLIEGAKAAAAIASNQEWRETRPAQFAVKEENLVDGVKEVLARHNVNWNVS